MSMTTFRMLVFFLLVVQCVAYVGIAQADGLIYRLPANGTWVEYSGEGTAEFKVRFHEPTESTGGSSGVSEVIRASQVLRVSSVGETTRARRPCRWIELDLNTKMIGESKINSQGSNRNVLKVLVPEKYLVRGQDPLNQVILAFWNPKDADLIGIPDDVGFDRVRYELDRFLPSFPPPLENEKQLPAESIQTPLREFRDCEVVTGESSFDRPTRDDGRWEARSIWKIALHPEAPFGVVRIEMEASAMELNSATIAKIEGKMTLLLTKTGTGAKSSLTSDTARQHSDSARQEGK